MKTYEMHPEKASTLSNNCPSPCITNSHNFENSGKTRVMLWHAFDAAVIGHWCLATRVPRNQTVMALQLYCISVDESHSHLFFECSYSSIVWYNIILACGIVWQPKPWHDLIDWASINWRRKSMQNLIHKIALATSVYYIWIERNARIFRNHYRDPNTLSQLICQTIRNRVSTLKFKPSSNNLLTGQLWNLPSSCFL